MKEEQEEYTNPILEECYRIKDEINAQFKTIEELSAYLKAQQEEDKRQGWKYVSFFDPSKHTPLEKSNDDI
jgi:transcriptional regulator of NAD metabolism